MTEKLVIESVQPILDQSRPAFFNRLTLTKCNLGTIAPVVTGVRYRQTDQRGREGPQGVHARGNKAGDAADAAARYWGVCRFVNTTEDVVRLDIHISWSGNPDIVLEVRHG